ncbi:MAG TPA: DUF6644 family protein [Sphingomonadaceae bacterium]|nr:DUF6644 family protein [Sphingomonadaceae bacterium]
MTIEAIAQRIYDLPFADAVRQSASLFPLLESIHVLALTLVFGTIAIVDLRLLGVRLHRASAKTLIAELLPYTWGAFALAVLSGGMLFSSNAVLYTQNTQFVAKMALILLAGLNMLAFHSTVYRRIEGWDVDGPPPAAARFAGATSLLLWSAIIILGRWVGFTLAPF